MKNYIVYEKTNLAMNVKLDPLLGVKPAPPPAGF
jgi:hypothetical protein